MNQVSNSETSWISNKLYLLAPIPIWVFFYAFILEQVFKISFAQSMVESAVASAFLFGTAFISINVLRFYSPSRDRILYVLSLAVAFSGVVVLGDVLIMNHVLATLVDVSIVQQSKFMLGGFAFLINGGTLGFGLYINALQDQQEVIAKHHQAETLNKEAELLKLRHQLQPHFLFNSLNSINALITIQPKEARKMVQQLSEFLRGTIRADEQSLVTIEKELKHLELYLKIEKVRFGHRLNTLIELDEAVNTMLIPSLLLQPLMENAIKFGLYGTTEMVDIVLDIKLENKLLTLVISNPIDLDVKSQKGTGFGLSSIKRRLFLLYGRADLLTTSQSDTTFSATLKIPQKND